MNESARHEDVAGVAIEERAIEVARLTAQAVRQIAENTPFASEPQDFLVTLEALAPRDDAS